MRSLRILLASVHAPLPEGSAAGRACYSLLRGLAGRGHRITAFAACQSAAEAQAANDSFSAPGCDLRCFAAPERHGIAAKLATLRRPYSYFFSRDLVSQWREEGAGGYDIVHLDEAWTGWLGLSTEAHRTVLNINNLYSIDWAADASDPWIRRMHRVLCVRTERKLIRSFPHLLAVTPELAAELARMAPRSTVQVAPLALDLERYSFVPTEKRPPDPVIAMIGSMDWPSSRSAAVRLVSQLWPEIRKELPKARLQITGRKARQALSSYLAVPGVEIQEDVPSMRPYFENASLLLYAPERGSGMKVKVLEAFAYGLPVVTTPTGVEGLEVENGVHAEIQETDQGLIDRALGLLRDPVRQEAQRRAARRLLEARHAPAAVVARLEDVYAAVLRRPRGHTVSRDEDVAESYADRG